MRGQITKKVNKIAIKFLGREIDTTELRLMPYIQYVMMNEQCLDIAKINSDERKILKKWRDKGYIEGGASRLDITKEFWDYMNEILFIAYVKQEEDED